MKSIATWVIALVGLGALIAMGQAPAAPQQGPGVQAPSDARYAAFVAKECKSPPGQGGGARGAAAPGAGPARGAPGPGGGAPRGAAGAAAGPGGGAPRGGAAAGGAPAHRDYTVTEIPGVIAAGQKWKSIWTASNGNNADGIIATSDGGILVAQNTDSAVMKIDKDGKVSFPYKDTNTGGALSMNKNGDLFIVSRGFPTSVWQLAPKRQILADKYNGEPLDCIGGVINDLTADSKGGVYFTMGQPAGVYYANAKGVVTKYGENLSTNGVVLSADEKTLYVTTRGLVAFDVQADGSLTKQRDFAALPNSDGTTVDAAGRVYTTNSNGVQVIAPDGKVLGAIPTPLNFITVAFSGPDKKTLYGVANNRQFNEIFTIPMIAQGYTGRAR